MNAKEYEAILRVVRTNECQCHDKRQCFAKNGGRCTILWSTYEDGECPFCKKSREE